MPYSVSHQFDSSWHSGDADPEDAHETLSDPTERYVRRLRLLREIDRAILTARSAAETAEVALAGLQTLVPYRRASVVLYDFAADEVLILAALRGENEEEDEPARAGAELHLPAGARTQLSAASVLGRAPLGEPDVIPDLRMAGLVHPWAECLAADGVSSYTVVPLIARDRAAGRDEVIGGLTLGLGRPGYPSIYALEIMGDIADSLAVAVRQVQLYEQVLRHSQELEANVAARTHALRLSQARFRAIFDAAPIGILLAGRDGRVLEGNPAFRAMLGCDAGQLQKLTFPALTRSTPETEARDAAQRFAAIFDGTEARLRLELPYVRQDGQTVWTQVTVAPVIQPAPGCELAVAMIEDVTEERATQAALMQAERLAITGRLGASLAHEINNPLQSIIGCLGLAEETLPNAAEATRYLEVAREELHRVARTVAQLRDLHGANGTEHSEPVQLNDILSQLLVLNAQRYNQQGVEVVWQPGRLPRVPVVQDGIRQVFLNLLLNALDAMPKGGRLEVRTTHTRTPAGVRVTFRDTGHGMAADVKDRVFEPFYTTKKQGLGLGLFTSRSIIERHGGTIEVDSRTGHGATFTLWLPLALEHNVVPAAEEAQAYV